MTLRERISALAARVAEEFNAVRAEMPSGGGGADPWTYVILGADFTTGETVSPVDIGIGFSPATNKQYVIEAKLNVRSSQNANGVRPGLRFPTMGGAVGAVRVQVAAGNNSDTIAHGANVSGGGTSALAINSNSSGALAMIDAICKTPGAIGGGGIQATVYGEVSGQTVTVVAGSYLRYRIIS